MKHYIIQGIFIRIRKTTWGWPLPSILKRCRFQKFENWHKIPKCRQKGQFSEIKNKMTHKNPKYYAIWTTTITVRDIKWSRRINISCSHGLTECSGKRKYCVLSALFNQYFCCSVSCLVAVSVFAFPTFYVSSVFFSVLYQHILPQNVK